MSELESFNETEKDSFKNYFDGLFDEYDLGDSLIQDDKDDFMIIVSNLNIE